MRITVQAHHPVHGQLVRAGRFWPVTEAVEVEVLDQEEDPAPIKITVKNATTGLPQLVERPDPRRMGKKSYRLLQADTRLSVKQGDSVTERMAESAITAARDEVTRLGGELLSARTEIAGLKEQLTIAEEKIAELQKLVDAKPVSSESAPPAATGDATPDAAAADAAAKSDAGKPKKGNGK